MPTRIVIADDHPPIPGGLDPLLTSRGKLSAYARENSLA